jgi:hypothetical protein
MPMPKLIPLRRQVDEPVIEDLDHAVQDEFGRIAPMVRTGARIALAVGSRGIGQLRELVTPLVRLLRSAGAEPVIVPAMGSHGGATAEGQQEILSTYGITEESVGAPIRSSMQVVELEPAGGPVRCFMDRLAFESDGVLLVNRVKPHTDFHGRWESGLVKMAVIGLGKHCGALEIHRHGIRGLKQYIPEAASRVFASGRILGGLAVVENSRHRAMLIRMLAADRILEDEPELLEIARRHLPALPVEALDLLFIERMGKDVSGVGIDTNVIGRIRIPGQAEPVSPRIRCVVVGDLTDASHGNAVGVGLADVITRRLERKIDWRATRENVITSGFLERGKLPVVAETEEEALAIGLRSCGYIPEGRERIVRIADTLHLHEFLASPAVADELRGRAGFEFPAASAGRL